MPATDAIAAIEAGPEGPEIGAFFDFDGTLIDGYSAVAYFADRLRRREMGLGEAVDVVRTALRSDMDENEIAGVIGKAMVEWAGRPEQELAELWSRLFKEKIASRLFPEAWSLVKAHQKMGTPWRSRPRPRAIRRPRSPRNWGSSICCVRARWCVMAA